jgi:hypothetical protein
MPVFELVPIKLVVDAIERVLQQYRRPLIAQHRHDQVRRAVVALPAVEIGKIVVEGYRRGDDAFFAFAVE